MKKFCVFQLPLPIWFWSGKIHVRLLYLLSQGGYVSGGFYPSHGGFQKATANANWFKPAASQKLTLDSILFDQKSSIL